MRTPRTNCYLCHTPLKKTGYVCCTKCSGRYSTLSRLGVLPISSEEYKDLQKVFSWDETSVLI